MSLFNLFKCTNSEINVFLNRDYGRLNTWMKADVDYPILMGTAVPFGSPISMQSNGCVGWSVANKKSTSVHHYTGDIILNKTGNAVTFTSIMWGILNR